MVICDVSGSMERYTRMLLHFIHSLYEGLENHVEAFLFATRLTRITRQLGQRDIDQSVGEVAKAVPDWSGGTRIGEALREFNFKWARRTLGWGSIVLIVSDGWDRGEPEALGDEMARLQRSCRRLIWLNPLAGAEDYEPLTRGMQAATPYIDDLLPVHNLAALLDLARHLNGPDHEPAGAQAASRAVDGDSGGCDRGDPAGPAVVAYGRESVVPPSDVGTRLRGAWGVGGGRGVTPASSVRPSVPERGLRTP